MTALALENVDIEKATDLMFASRKTGKVRSPEKTICSIPFWEALEELCEATVATLPGSVGSRQGRRLAKRMTGEMQGYFERLERRFPMSKILSFAGKYMVKRPEDYKYSLAEKQKVQERVAKIIGAPKDSAFEGALAEYSAIGYMIAAIEIEYSLRKQFKIQESAVIAEATLRADFLDQPIPLPVIDWAKAEAATKVTAMGATTQRELASVIADTMTHPRRGVPDVATAIQDRFTDMSRTRAELIATTEMNRAMSQGTLDRGVSMGAKEKEWITVGDDRVNVPICQANGGQDRIRIGRAFQSGDMQPPGHPRCRCALGTFGATRATARQGISPDGRREWLSNIGKGVTRKRIPKRPMELKPGMSADRWGKSLTSNELRVVDYWQGLGYERIRQAQMSGKLGTLKSPINTFEKALDRAQGYKGEVFRGLHDLDARAFAQISKATEFKWNALTSSAKTEKAAARFIRSEEKGKQSILFQINNKTGIDLTPAVGVEEAEVLLRKGARYTVTSRVEETFTVAGKKHKALKIILEEI